ncbi:hypothetical protein Axi01nite_07360 [Actinoplanes xinjiangensis]|nr:hypothetical protein Axi01nite_07360 [Actinoplanes xinjiangensis]
MAHGERSEPDHLDAESQVPAGGHRGVKTIQDLSGPIAVDAVAVDDVRRRRGARQGVNHAVWRCKA